MASTAKRDVLGRSLSVATVVVLGLTQAACYVMPVDARTGLPLAPAADGQPARGSAYVASPAPVAAAPQPSLLNVRLYPLNPPANSAGMLQATVLDNNAGRGTFAVGYRGDTLQGESLRVDASYPAFGRVFAAVLGPTTRSFSGRRGIANAHGTRGIDAQCEYVLTGPGTGTGVCQFSDGAAYQMHFGS
jgi:hypothetical protein